VNPNVEKLEFQPSCMMDMPRVIMVLYTKSVIQIVWLVRRMPLDATVIVRLNGKLEERLQALALEAGLSKSAIMRNTLAIALMEPQKPSMMRDILERAEKEQENELYVRSHNAELDHQVEKTMAIIKSKISKRNHNGEDQSITEKEAVEKAKALKKTIMEPEQ
jgi:predicted DNA-binding protein